MVKRKNKKVLKSTIKKREKRLEKRKLKDIWFDCRVKVKKLQENRCYMCPREIFDKSAHIHHIISRDIKEFKYDIQNLVLLCPRCHKLSPLSVHQTAILFSEVLRSKEPKRFEYLISKVWSRKL